MLVGSGGGGGDSEMYCCEGEREGEKREICFYD